MATCKDCIHCYVCNLKGASCRDEKNYMFGHEVIMMIDSVEVERNCEEYLPSDVAPVRHGHWEQVDDTKCKCSECEVITMIAQYPIGADKNYCPNCGAKMDGERKENDNDT